MGAQFYLIVGCNLIVIILMALNAITFKNKVVNNLLFIIFVLSLLIFGLNNLLTFLLENWG